MHPSIKAGIATAVILTVVATSSTPWSYFLMVALGFFAGMQWDHQYHTVVNRVAALGARVALLERRRDKGKNEEEKIN